MTKQLTKTIIELLPNDFEGFYDSNLSALVDGEEESEIEYRKECLMEEHNLSWDQVNEIDFWRYINTEYSKAYNLISEEYMEKFFDLIKEYELKDMPFNMGTINYHGLRSPKYYNFETDKLEIEIELDEDMLIAYAKEHLHAFSVYIRDNFTSRDGFICFHTNNVDAWLDGQAKDYSEYIWYTYMFNFYITNTLLDMACDPYYNDLLEQTIWEVKESLCQSTSELIYGLIEFDEDGIEQEVQQLINNKE